MELRVLNIVMSKKKYKIHKKPNHQSGIILRGHILVIARDLNIMQSNLGRIKDYLFRAGKHQFRLSHFLS